MFLHQLPQSCDLPHRCMSRSRLLSRAFMNLFFPAPQCLKWFGSNFQRDVCWFWSGAGRFVLKLLDMDRINLGPSAREFISFSQIENLPDLTVDALTAPSLYGKSSIKPFCLVRFSPVFITGVFPGGSDPSRLSFPKACPATVVCCPWSRDLWPVSCTRVAPAFSRLVSCTLRVFVVDHGEQLFKWVVMCLCVPCYTFLGFWNAMGVASGEFVSLLSPEPHVVLSSAVSSGLQRASPVTVGEPYPLRQSRLSLLPRQQTSTCGL